MQSSKTEWQNTTGKDKAAACRQNAGTCLETEEWNTVLLSSSQNKPTLQNKLLQESSVADATFSLTRYYE